MFNCTRALFNCDGSKMSKIFSIFVLLCVTVTLVQCHSPDVAGAKVQFDVRPVAAMYNAMTTTFPNLGENVKKPFESLTTDAALALGYRCNIMIVASGFSTEQLPCILVSRQFYKMAYSLAKLCAKLETMEKCFDILMESSLETGYFATRGDLKGNFQSQIAEYYTNAVETKVEKDSELSAIYKQIKLDSPSEYVDLEKAGEIGRRELGKTTVKFMLYKMHVRHSYGNISTTVKKEYYVTARSVFELAKNFSKVESIQKLYDQAIVEVINSWDNELEHDGVIRDTPTVLYSNVEQKILLNSELKDDYEGIREMVAKSSKWTTTGSFDDDFLPL